MPLVAALAMSALFVAGPVHAHMGQAGHGSLLSGLLHPLAGPDHFVAMVTVGVWATLADGRALWLAPTAFVGAMLAGFGLALAGAALPLTEPMVLASAVVLGLLAAIGLAVPTPAVVGLVALFALFHGAAHGAEMGPAAALPYATGFAVATAALHAAGIAITRGLLRFVGDIHRRTVTRGLGLAGAAAGLALVLT